MFNIGLKNRTREAIIRAVRGSMLCAYLHPREIEKLGLNDAASFLLLTESFALHLNALGIIFSNECRQYKWATFDFFVDSVLDAIDQSEAKDTGVESSTIAPLILSRYPELERFSDKERLADKHYGDSANLVAKQDSTANIQEIVKILKSSTDRYFSDAKKMFS